MSLLNSVNNLTSSVADKVKQVGTLTKIAACLPSVLTSLPAALGAAAGSVIGAGANIIKNLASGATGFIQGIIDQTVTSITNAVTSLINTVLNIEAQLVASFNQLKALYNYLENEVNDTAEWIKNSENCNFAAAELVNCIAGRLLTQLSSTFADRINGGFCLSLDSALDDITSKIEEPANKLNDWVNNTARQIDKATSVVNAANLF